MFAKWLRIELAEWNVFKLHLVFSILQGILVGVFALNEFVFIKDILGSDFQLSVLLQFSALVFLFSIFVNEFLRRVKNKRKMLRWAAIITHSPLLLLVFFPNNREAYTQSDLFNYLFLALFFMFYLNTIVVLPAINQMLKNNYSHENFSRLYSYSSSINKIIIMFTTLGFGFLLDFDNYSFVYIYPIVALLGILSVFMLSRISYADRPIIRLSFWNATKNSIQSTVQILKSNRSYLHFEIGFMLYGFAWMVSTVVIPIYFNDVFHMNHATYGFYKNGYNLLAIILLPYFGSLLGKIDPRKFGIYTFGSLMLFMIFLALAGVFPHYWQIGEIKVYYVLMVAYGFYGVFAATMALLWFIGSAYFCSKEEAAQYQSIHLTLTGLRSLFAFQIGVAFYLWFGYLLTFSISAFSLLLAVLVMLWSYRKSRLVEN